ncbi:MAG: ABC transporter ATP-binding protein [Pseudomonadota bacterium]
MTHDVLAIDDLTISFPDETTGNRRSVVKSVDLAVKRGERIGIVGESGSGKTMIGRAVLGLLPAGGRIDGGRIRFGNQDMADLGPAQLRRIRGAGIGMIFQEPMVSLNPALTIGLQMIEGLRLHAGLNRRDAEQRAVEMLHRVRLPDPRGALERYPHSFSGGMRQRIMLASVLLLEPDLLIADEPTTALDALIQKEVLDLMLELVRDLGTALLLISHDLPLVARYMERVIVMRHGAIREAGPVAQILTAPSDRYTRTLLDALPGSNGQFEKDTNRGVGETLPDGAGPLVDVRNLAVAFEGSRTWPWSRPPRLQAVDDVSLTVQPGEIVALVGESGSGKTTLGRAILDLVPVSAGSIRVDGESAGRARQIPRHAMQIVFQDPYSSLDPRMTIDTIIAEGLRLDRSLSRAERRDRVHAMLEAVQMPSAQFGSRFPHELSGGQRQRVAIARALVSRPRFIVADEPVSALDLTVQKEILALLADLQQAMGFAALFISHDMAVVEEIADRVVVLLHGRVVEAAEKAAFFAAPRHPYSRRLLHAVPELAFGTDGQRVVRDRRYAESEPPPGHVFAEPAHQRADYVYVSVAEGHSVACVAQ